MTKIELLQYLVYAQYALVVLSVLVVAARVFTPQVYRAEIGRVFRALFHLPKIEA
jgi:hypothetical protein